MIHDTGTLAATAFTTTTTAATASSITITAVNGATNETTTTEKCSETCSQNRPGKGRKTLSKG